MARSAIPEVLQAGYLYGVKHFRYPVDVSHYEDKTGVPADARLTCGHCKSFRPSAHTVEHHSQMETKMKLPGMP